MGGGQEPVTVGPPARVFDDPYRADTTNATRGMANYDISPDGTRFVMIEEPRASPPAVAPTPKVQVIVNWTEELKRRVPVN